MMVLVLFLCALLLLPIIVDTILLLLWLFQKEIPDTTQEELPMVSILLAARNEERNISRCIESLLGLRYPLEKLEILIGDDSSEDHTLEIINEYSKQHDHISVLEIKHEIPGQKGKANVLAQLSANAKGEFLFFTDADVEVPGSWVEEMLKGFSREVGIVSGITGIKGEGYFSLFQFMDWVFALGMTKVITHLGYSVTALGNNMAVKREAYDAVGGYENIPFSITEDFELLRQIQKKGYKGNQLFNIHVRAWSLPEPNFKTLVHQRKRWMKGALQLPKIMVGILFVQALFFPVLIVVLVINFNLGLIILAIKIFIQSAFINYAFSKLERNEKPISLILYEFYSMILSLSLLFYFYLPYPLKWKGRQY